MGRWLVGDDDNSGNEGFSGCDRGDGVDGGDGGDGGSVCRLGHRRIGKLLVLTARLIYRSQRENRRVSCKFAMAMVMA